MKDFLLTASGKRFYPADPKPEMICLADIAQGLSQLCRFSGQTSVFYSVAQHCLHVSSILKRQGASIELQLAGLLHDASEAYMADVPRPVKIRLTNYREMEDTVVKVIFEKYKLNFDLYHQVKEADIVALKTEFRDIIGVGTWEYPGIKEDITSLKPLSSIAAKATYLETFVNLLEARNEKEI